MMTTRIGTRIVLLVAMFGTIGCDQVTKHLAATSLSGTAERSFLGDTVRLQFVENTGGFLSLGAALPPVARTVRVGPVRTGIFNVADVAIMLGVVVFAIAGLRNAGPSGRT